MNDRKLVLEIVTRYRESLAEMRSLSHADCTGENEMADKEKRERWDGTPVVVQNVAFCGCREYPEYGDACLLLRGHDGPHDWQKVQSTHC
jgi:hypothetical protein